MSKSQNQLLSAALLAHQHGDIAFQRQTEVLIPELVEEQPAEQLDDQPAEQSDVPKEADTPQTQLLQAALLAHQHGDISFLPQTEVLIPELVEEQKDEPIVLSEESDPTQIHPDTPQLQLLQSAIRARQTGEVHIPKRKTVKEIQPIEDNDPGASLITSKADQTPVKSVKHVVIPSPPLEKYAVVPPSVEDVVVSPRVVHKPAFKGNLAEHPSIKQALQEHFKKVQVGEDRLIVSGGKGQLENCTVDSMMEFLTSLISHQSNFDADVFRGNHVGRYRIIAK